MEQKRKLVDTNWLRKHLNLKLSNGTFRMQLVPSCKFKMVMPAQNYNFICSCIQILQVNFCQELLFLH